MNKITLKFFITLLFMGIGTMSYAQTNLFEHPEFATLTKDHKTIAIVPFKAQVLLRPKQMKETSAEQLAEMEKSEGLAIQQSLFTWFLQRKKRGKFHLEVQDPAKTNAILSKNNITDLSLLTPEELAKLLEVDAVISGRFETDKPMSDGASLALGLLVGFYGTTNSATINMNVNNAEDGVLLWNYNKRVAGSLGSSTDSLINTLMRKASRRMAYTQ